MKNPHANISVTQTASRRFAGNEGLIRQIQESSQGNNTGYFPGGVPGKLGWM